MAKNLAEGVVGCTAVTHSATETRSAVWGGVENRQSLGEVVIVNAVG